MKKYISLILSVFLTITLIGTSACAEQKEDYSQIFEKDKIIDINIDIDEADLEDIRNYPQNEEYHCADITVDGIKVENAGIRTKGNMTLKSVANSDSDRYSYRIKFNKSVKGNKLLGLGELCLNNGYSDPSYMREYLHYEVLRKLGMNVPETAFCNVYINGDYAGFYLAVEGLDDTFLKDNFGENYKNGNLYKMDEGSTLEYKEDENYSYADLKSGSDEDLTSFKEFVKKLNSVTTGEKGDIESFLNVDSALKYIASNTVLCNYDSYNGNMHHNFYLYEDENGVFTVVPWDFNMSFGGFNGENAEVGIDTPYISGSLETLPLINKLLSVPEYKEIYYGYIKEIMGMLESFESRVDELKAKISPYVKNDITSFYTYEEFDKATTKQTESTDFSKAQPSGKSAEGDSAQEGKQENRRGGKSFGGVSIINCVEDRLKNLTEQFEGTSSKTTTAQNGAFGGNRRDRDGNQPPQMSDGNQPPQMSDGNQPPQMSDGNQPPQMSDGNQPPQMSDGNQPPQMSDGNQPPRMSDGNQPPRPNMGGKEQDNGGTNPIRVHLNGHILKFNSAPYLKNDSTMVGFRSILEALGAEVEWNESTQTVTALKDGTEIMLKIGDSTAYVNGKAYSLPAVPELADDTTMIPVRFISEELGMKVGWDDSGQLVTITSK